MEAIFRDRRAIALLLTASISVMSNAIISPSLPGIEATYPDTPNAGMMTRLLVAAPSLLVALFAPFAGMLADRFGRRRQLLVGVGIFGLVGSAGLWLPSLELLFASRLVLGLGVAMIMTSQTALVGDYFSGPARGRFMGIQIACMNFGGLIFIATAGYLGGLGPFLPFALYAVGLLYLPYLYFALEEPTTAEREALAASAGADGADGWVVLLVSAVVLGGLTFVTFYIVPTQAAYFLPLIGYDDPAAAASLMVAMTFAAGAVSLVYGRILGILGRARVLALGFVLMALGFVALSLAQSLVLAACSILLMGAGAGLVMPTLMAVALEVAPVARRGMAAGAVTMSIFLGQFLSPFISMPLVTHYSFPVTFEIFAVVLLCCAGAAGLIFRRRQGVPVNA